MAGGEVAVVDLGGAGPDILLTHSVGYCAVQWRPLARLLTDTHHVYAYDMRGHGRTTAELTDYHQPGRDIVELITRLELADPVLVGHDSGTWHAILAALERPDLVHGVVGLAGSFARPHQQLVEALEFAGTEEMAHIMRDGFLLGATGSGEDSKRELVETLVARARNDWLISEIVDGLADEVRRSMVDLLDGTWLHKPCPETVATCYRVPADSSLFPNQRLIRRLKVPFWYLLPRMGHDADMLTAFRELFSQLPEGHLLETDAGQFPHCSHPQVVADLISRAATR